MTSYWQAERKGAAFSFLAGEPHAPAVSLDYLVGYVESNAQATIIVRGAGVGSVEPLEYSRLFAKRDAYSVIGNSDDCLTIFDRK